MADAHSDGHRLARLLILHVVPPPLIRRIPHDTQRPAIKDLEPVYPNVYPIRIVRIVKAFVFWEKSNIEILFKNILAFRKEKLLIDKQAKNWVSMMVFGITLLAREKTYAWQLVPGMWLTKMLKETLFI